MKSKLFLGLMALALVFTACNGDEIDALKKRIKTLESITGAAEPIFVNFKTTNYDNDEVNKNTAFRFKTSDSESSKMQTYGGSQYYITIRRFLTVSADENISLYFTYDAETGEAYDGVATIQFYSKDNNEFETSFYGYDSDNEFNLTVKSFDPETGMINLSVNTSTTENSSNNYYDGHVQTLELSFKGKLTQFDGNL